MSSKNLRKTDSSSISYKTPFCYEKYKKYKKQITEASQNNKIFTISGEHPKLREALVTRNWVEKVNVNQLLTLRKLSQHALLNDAQNGNNYERLVLTKMLENFSPNFIWQPNRLDRKHENCCLMNRIRKKSNYDFSTKIGLSRCSENSNWSFIENVSEMNCPRSFSFVSLEEKKHFIWEFRMTGCLALLNFINSSKEILFSNDGKIPLSIIEEALNFVERKLFDISDNSMKIDWDNFFRLSDLLIKSSEKFKQSPGEYMTKIKKLLMKTLEFWPNRRSDGYLNIWILKPSHGRTGNGIQIFNDLKSISNEFDKNSKKFKYVIQKYIERPLLIFKTKFDIRQYFLVTLDDKSLTIWMYKECYLKFSSQEFSLTNFERSIHLTNHAVQKYYKNGERSERLPTENMWSLSEFQEYLKEIGVNENVWSDQIYDGMKKNIVASIISSLESIELTNNCFELYGCDFMITEDFDVFLIEINCCPDMSSSTSVTRKICGDTFEDLVKVVIDLPNNPNSSTGNFEQIYKIEFPKNQNYVALKEMSVIGTRISLKKEIRSFEQETSDPELELEPKKSKEKKKKKRSSKQTVKPKKFIPAIEKIGPAIISPKITKNYLNALTEQVVASAKSTPALRINVQKSTDKKIQNLIETKKSLNLISSNRLLTF